MENKKPATPRPNRSWPIDGIIDLRSPRAPSPRAIDEEVKSAPQNAQPYESQQKPVAPPLSALPQETINQPKKGKKKIIIAIVALVLIALITACIAIFTNNSKTKAPAKPKETQTESRSSAEADEKKPAPDALASYKVAADLPRVIRIEKIKIKSRVLALGVKSNNELKAPVNIYDSGWYLESAKPGAQGAMLIDGHVSGPTQKGIFYDLKKLVAGDTIKIERGDGKTFSYSVIKSKVYDKDKVDMAAALTPIESGKPGLNLITCTGSFNNQSDQYEDRLVVFASLQN